MDSIKIWKTPIFSLKVFETRLWKRDKFTTLRNKKKQQKPNVEKILANVLVTK